jgi:hypothetical protein
MRALLVEEGALTLEAFLEDFLLEYTDAWMYRGKQKR